MAIIPIDARYDGSRPFSFLGRTILLSRIRYKRQWRDPPQPSLPFIHLGSVTSTVLSIDRIACAIALKICFTYPLLSRIPLDTRHISTHLPPTTTVLKGSIQKNPPKQSCKQHMSDQGTITIGSKTSSTNYFNIKTAAMPSNVHTLQDKSDPDIENQLIAYDNNTVAGTTDRRRKTNIHHETKDVTLADDQQQGRINKISSILKALNPFSNYILNVGEKNNNKQAGAANLADIRGNGKVNDQKADKSATFVLGGILLGFFYLSAKLLGALFSH